MLIYGIRTKKAFRIRTAAAPATTKTHKKVIKFYYFQKIVCCSSFSSRNFVWFGRKKNGEKERGLRFPKATTARKPKRFACFCFNRSYTEYHYSPSGNSTGQFMAPIIAIMCSLFQRGTMKTMQLNSNFMLSESSFWSG